MRVSELACLSYRLGRTRMNRYAIDVSLRCIVVYENATHIAAACNFPCPHQGTMVVSTLFSCQRRQRQRVVSFLDNMQGFDHGRRDALMLAETSLGLRSASRPVIVSVNIHLPFGISRTILWRLNPSRILGAYPSLRRKRRSSGFAAASNSIALNVLPSAATVVKVTAECSLKARW